MQRPRLRLVDGGLERRYDVRGVRVVASPEGRAPFALDAMVEEQDTWLLLGDEAPAVEVREPYRDILEAMERYHPARPGSVVVRNGRPVRLLAVVHDVERDPSWRSEWISSALDGVLRLSELRSFKALGLPVLGGRHGGVEPDAFARMLPTALARARPRGLERIWLMMPAGHRADTLEL